MPKGFTLIELLVTISIVAILAAVGLVMYTTAQKSARISKRIQDLKALQTAIELYKTSTGAYPIYNAGSGACIATSLAALVPTYMPSLPSDPLGGTNCYWYFSDLNGTEYKIRTEVTTSGEMTAPLYNQQTSLIDPARDGGASINCPVDGTNPTAWALFSGTNACSY